MTDIVEDETEKDEVRVTVRLTKEQSERLDRIRNEEFRGINRNMAIRWLIEERWERRKG